MTCVLCDRITQIKKNEYPFLIHEFKHSFWTLGDHQFFKGYSQIVYKDHVRDMFQTSKDVQIELFMEVMKAEEVSRKALNPWKMNLSMYGNAVPHIHWHLFPRYETEADCKKVPWFYMNDFDSKPSKETDYQSLIKKMKEHL